MATQDGSNNVLYPPENFITQNRNCIHPYSKALDELYTLWYIEYRFRLVAGLMKVVDVARFLYDEVGLCGCSDLESARATLISLLEWHKRDSLEKHCEELFHGDEGVFYLLMAILDKAGLSDHGTSICNPFLTTKGEGFLVGLRRFTAEEIENVEY